MSDSQSCVDYVLGLLLI